MKEIRNLDSLELVDINVNDAKSLLIFKQFYDEVFIGSFKNQDERETYENFLYYLEKYSDQTLYVHVLIFLDNDKIVGGVIFDYYDEIESLVVEFIAVAKNYQNQGVATEILKKTKEYLTVIKKKKIQWTIIEIDNPKYHNDDLAYYYFWEKHGMKAINFQYIQPALSKDKKPVETLILCATNEHREVNTIEIMLVKKFLLLYSYYAMDIFEPMRNPSILYMFEQLENNKIGKLELFNLTMIAGPMRQSL